MRHCTRILHRAGHDPLVTTPAVFARLLTFPEWILTLLNVVFVQRDFGLLFDVPQLKSFAFGRFWNKYGMRPA